MTSAARVESYFAQLERRVRRVFRANPTLMNQLDRYGWSIGALGDPYAGIWFMAENPAAARVQAIGNKNRDKPSRELEWAASKGDLVFRRALARVKLKDRPIDAPGGWHCYITDVLKSPVKVKDFKRVRPEGRRYLMSLWAPVLRWELEVGQPRLIVTMGANVCRMVDELIGSGAIEYSGERRHVTHYASIGNQPLGHLPPMDPGRVRRYFGEFDRIARDWSAIRRRRSA